MKGWGTNENSIIDVIGNRTNTERQAIIKMYNEIYGKVNYYDTSILFYFYTIIIQAPGQGE